MMPVDQSQSAVGTGKKDYRGFYETPLDLAKSAIKLLGSPQPHKFYSVFDAGAGRGIWGKALRELYDYRSFPFGLTGCDLYFNEKPLGYDAWFHVDFFKIPNYHYDYVMMNPPFTRNMLEKFVRKGFSMLKHHGRMVVLTPLNFLATQDRARGLWAEIPPTEIYVLANRVNFGGTSGAMFECCLNVWNKADWEKPVIPNWSKVYLGHFWRNTD